MRSIPLLAACALTACSAPDEPAAPSPTSTASPTAPPVELSCASPVRPGDTAAMLAARFGADARMETLGGPEGMEFKGMALFPRDPARRLEVIFDDDATGLASAVRLRGETAWPVAGVRLGDPLATVRAANGAAFELWGFGWDYGGYVSDLKRGHLAELRGGCSLSIRFDPAADFSADLAGEVTLSSDDPGVAAAQPRLSELTLNFPEQPPQK